jgi:very-short-patch-repair endonuclease
MERGKGGEVKNKFMVKVGNPSQFDFYFGASKKIIDYAKALRKQMTPAEGIMWKELRNRNFSKFKFRRQHPIERFIADFYCPEKKLVIEIDGDIHDNLIQKEYDIGRNAEIEKYDIQIIRFNNEEVLNNIENVLDRIKEKMKS